MENVLKFGSAVVYVDNVAEVLSFYREAFGLEPRFHDPTVGFAELGSDGFVAIASHEAGEMMLPGVYPRSEFGRTRSLELAFHTDDVAAAYGRAVGAGAGSLSAPTEMPWGQTVAFVESIEGTIIAFVTPPKA